MNRGVWIGYEPREQDALEVAAASMRTWSPKADVFTVDLGVLVPKGLYQRPIERRDGQLWDKISNAPMSTEFAISRFFVPLLAKSLDWAIFMDCDVMLRADIDELFELADPSKAVQVVKHDYRPGESVKMDGQAQTSYPRKNWSSVILWNVQHPANKALTLGKLNSWSGRALHGFQWLDDQFIGELPAEWNHLVGVEPENPDAKLVHFTLGVPSMEGYGNCEHAAEWWRYRLPQQPPDVRAVAHLYGQASGCRHPSRLN
jgi:hypothetical protein